MDVLACPVISPLSCHADSCGPPSTHPRWVSISITCWTAFLPRLAKWLRALPGAGGAATTGKDVPVTLTLGTTVQSWRNSVSSAISLILGLFTLNPLHILSPTVSASSFPFLAGGIPIKTVMLWQLTWPLARALQAASVPRLRADSQHVAGPLSTQHGRQWLVLGRARTQIAGLGLQKPLWLDLREENAGTRQ